MYSITFAFLTLSFYLIPIVIIHNRHEVGFVGESKKYDWSVSLTLIWRQCIQLLVGFYQCYGISAVLMLLVLFSHLKNI
jgi:hypothetical protein